MKPYYEDESIKLYNADCTLFSSVVEKCDLIFTDPPYGIDLEQFLFLVDFDFVCGHSFVMNNERNIINFASKRIELFRKLFAVDTIVPNMISSKTPMTQVDYIAEFRDLKKQKTKFINTRDGFSTLIKSSKNREKSQISQNFDKSEKIASAFITHYSNVGDLVFDPFAGSCSTLIAAKKLGRRAIGFELSEETCFSAREILSQTDLFCEITL